MSRFSIVGTRSVQRGTDAYGHRKYVDEPREKRMTWNQIFSAVGAYLYSYISYEDFVNKLKKGINSVIGNEMFFGELNEDCVQTIKIQLKSVKTQ